MKFYFPLKNILGIYIKLSTSDYYVVPTIQLLTYKVANMHDY